MDPKKLKAPPEALPKFLIFWKHWAQSVVKFSKKIFIKHSVDPRKLEAPPEALPKFLIFGSSGLKVL